MPPHGAPRAARIIAHRGPRSGNRFAVLKRARVLDASSAMLSTEVADGAVGAAARPAHAVSHARHRRPRRTVRRRDRPAPQHVRAAARARYARRQPHRHRRRDGDRQRAAAPARALGGRAVRPRQPIAAAAGCRWCSPDSCSPRPAWRSFPSSARFGLIGLIAAIVVLYSGINLQRSPFHALIADVVPSRYRALAIGSVTFQMCVGAVVFLMLGRMMGMRTAFLIAAGAVLAIAVTFAARAAGTGTDRRRRRRKRRSARSSGAVWTRGARRRAGHARDVPLDAAAADDLPVVHDLVRAARHRTLRREARRRDDRLHRVGHGRRRRRAARPARSASASAGATPCCSDSG